MGDENSAEGEGECGAETKRAADFVTDDVEWDGLFKAFCRLGLISG